VAYFKILYWNWPELNENFHQTTVRTGSLIDIYAIERWYLTAEFMSRRMKRKDN
jgi:hypothetical protein